jgi:hypothetical protein
MIREIKLKPTREAIDTWLSLTQLNRSEDAVYVTEYTHFGVDIRTKAGSWRCIISGQAGLGITSSGIEDYGYWTIRGEGSSNGSRETWIFVKDVVAARGHIID